jgi:hypothetical protein
MTLVARHPRPKELEGVSIEEIAKHPVARFGERKRLLLEDHGTQTRPS